MTMATEAAKKLTVNNVSFDVWFKALKECFEAEHGVGIDDLPDQDFLALYEDGFSVKDAIVEVKETADDDFGNDDNDEDDGIGFGDYDDDDDDDDGWGDDDDE